MPNEPRCKLIAINCRYSHSCPALFSLRNCIEKHSTLATVRIEQYTLNDPYYPTLQRIAAGGFDAFFFSVYIWNHEIVGRLISDIRLILPHALIVLGGPEAIQLNQAMREYGISIVRGEAESLPSEFYEDLQARQLKPSYASTGPATTFPSPYRPDDLATLLADRHVYYESSRGCPFSCSYCLSATEKGVRHKDIALVKRELLEIIPHRPVSVRFVDRTFNAAPDRALALWEFLAQNAEGTTFHFEVAPDLFTEEMFSLLEGIPHGLFQFELGLQSTNESVLRTIRRPMDPARARDGIARLAAMERFHIHADLILGLPREEARTFKQSFADLFNALPDHIQMGLLKVLPGTPLYQKRETYRLVHRKEPPYEILSTKWLDHNAIRELHWFGRTVEAFYNSGRFRFFFRFLKGKKEAVLPFFEDLASRALHNGLIEAKPSEKEMSRMMAAVATSLGFGGIVMELLRYDWFLGGHRSLPAHLGRESGEEARSRDRARAWAPAALPPYYSERSRNGFLNKTVFFPFSREAVQNVGLGDRGGIVGFISRNVSCKKENISSILFDFHL